ncbi:MAG: translation initiation factor IF-2 [Saprospiraceae bacterium]|nr:translation initiation factor IF-2 [Saprospiraceae bacterium]MCB9325111.1 translation initiation factor IF-2 [Lewinellaceae bacterium]
MKRLIKVAKELNVGIHTIVEHLNRLGFEIDEKPTAKVTDEMYNELLNKYQKSIAIKEKADRLIIGTRPTSSKEAPYGSSHVSEPKKETPPPPIFKKEAVKPPVEAPKPVEEKVEPAATPEPPKEEIVSKPEAPKLKIIGKIDLDKPAHKQKEEPKQEPKEEPKEEPKQAPKEEPKAVKEETAPPAQVAEEKPVIEEKVAEVKETVPEKSTPKSDSTPVETPIQKTPEEVVPTPEIVKEVPAGSVLHKAETPELRGLKIQGKIDIDKFKKQPKKKKKEVPKAKPAGDVKKATPGTPGTSSDADADSKKRRRRRKKVVSPSNNNSQGGGQNRPNTPSSSSGDRNRNRDVKPPLKGRKDEVKEISTKEIEEKLKATLARIQGGSKKTRQKLRRDHRDRHREREEMKELEGVDEKLQLTEFISVSDLASLLDVEVSDVIMTCMNVGVMVSINQRLDAEIIEIVAGEFDREVEFISVEEQVDDEVEVEDDPADLLPRAPIVTVMGHVDHGKTSLLDYIREAKVAAGEAGGITQHIGAYEVKIEGQKITFLDTPGHEAFTAMRARGAKVTDIAIIIIAADDNIMPQTKEAISHAQAANVPMIFAINKIDKPGAQPERIKQELASMNLLVEDWGGTYQSQDISAKTGENIDKLLEKVLLEAEVQELKANPDREAVGAILEASLDKGKGYVAKILVQSGTLSIGDAVVAGEHSGKIKAMYNEFGKRVKTAGPSTPVLVLGLSGAPQAGERFKVTESETEARQIANKRAQIVREQTNRATKRISLDEIGRRLALGNFKELNLIVKGDVDGSIEALSDSLIKLSVETVQVNVIHKAVGQVIESDVMLASASDAIIIAFQVRPSLNARQLAEKEGVQVKTYSIIYEAIEEIKMAIEGLLEPTKEEKITAQVEVREVFKISKVGTIAGCFVREGSISRNSHLRLIREGIVIYPVKEGVVGELSSLKRFKDDAKEVKAGLECGVSIKNYNDIRVGDVIECYEIIEIKQRL